jgi:phosphopantothenoylcysteine decarboxylase/phosphopantothenate--cysteine ligase
MRKMMRRPSRDIYCEEGDELLGINVLLCITGSVAAYKAVDLARLMVKHGAEVYAVMSQVTSKTFLTQEMMRWATGNDVITELTGNLEHISLTDPSTSDLIIVYPATANTIGKFASGIDDTVVTSVLTVALGSKVPILICPAMHEAMYYNKIIQENINRLKINGVEFLQPRIEKGKAKVASADAVLQYILNSCNKSKNKPLVGKNFLITTGSTIEYIDPIRVIMNMSSGKMGMTLAKDAYDRGGNVTVIYGHGSADPSMYLEHRSISIRRVNTAQEMFESVKSELSRRRYDAVILAAATSDFSVAKRLNNKVESNTGKVDITLIPINKIIEKVKEVCGYDVFLIGFKAEYKLEPTHLIEKAYEKLLESGADLIVANDVGNEKTGFGSDYNEVYIIDRDKNISHLRLQPKERIAEGIIDIVERKMLCV